jgi:hypothetical protein
LGRLVWSLENLDFWLKTNPCRNRSWSFHEMGANKKRWKSFLGKPSASHLGHDWSVDLNMCLCSWNLFLDQDCFSYVSPVDFMSPNRNQAMQLEILAVQHNNTLNNIALKNPRNACPCFLNVAFNEHESWHRASTCNSFSRLLTP